ncbi:hypothetical protein ACS0TY_023195 [Phlomoides rotata]
MAKGTLKCSANYIPLSPISFLERSALVYRDSISVIYGDLSFTWKQTHQRCLTLASALTRLGISRGDVVAALAPNIPAMYELHFAVPMAGAVLCTLNIRHDADMVSVLLNHSESKIIFVDFQFLDVAKGAFEILSQKGIKLPHLVLIQESYDQSKSGVLDYEALVASGEIGFAVVRPNDEWDPIALNYTFGTTSSPKGVVYSHRGAYLNSLAAALRNEMLTMPVYLWTVPMFHCNGWCLTWAVAAQGGTNICLRNVTSKGIFDSIATHRVTHMGGAPTVLNMIINSSSHERKPLPGKVSMITGAAPSPPYVLFKMEELGFNIIHAYGLTETYGPGTICTWKPEWNSLSLEEQAKMKARQGLHHLGMEEIDVKDPVTMQSAPPDGKTIGEVMFRGNTVMSGYFKDCEATREAFKDGWFWSGDLGVKHSDGYIELKDRSKDVIISGGENISTIEVESVSFGHTAVLEAVVGRPNDLWGEAPCAIAKLNDGCEASAGDISRNLFQDTNQKVRKSIWCVKEDIALMSSWCFISRDKICGKNKKVGSMWTRVHNLYEKVRKENPNGINERNIDSMKGRYKRLSENANKWIAAYKEAHGRKRSGMNQQDVEREAHTIYEKGGQKFLDLHVFNEVMSKHPKWEIKLVHDSTCFRAEDEKGNEESGDSSKRPRTSEDGVYSIPTNPETPGSGGSTISLPIDRDKVEKKEKDKTSQFSMMSKLGRERIDLEREKMKHSLLMTLLAKDHLSPAEEEMKLHLWSLFK